MDLAIRYEVVTVSIWQVQNVIHVYGFLITINLPRWLALLHASSARYCKLLVLSVAQLEIVIILHY